jgi:hypothetical protein
MRHFVRSNTFGTPRTLTCAAFSGTDVDFRDITIAGAAAPVSGTRLSNCGGNTGITFPSPKTVYWNLAGVNIGFNNIAFASTSGGTPNAANFPLAQDTAVFDNAGAVGGPLGFGSYNIGTINASARTTAGITWSVPTGSNPIMYGDFILGPSNGFVAGIGTIIFSGRGTQTISSSGANIRNGIRIESLGTVQLAAALMCDALNISSGTFDAVSYNVTVGDFTSTTGTRTLRMGSGTWSFGNNWDVSSSLNFNKGTANIVHTNTALNVRAFSGGGFSYNKLTIGGGASQSTLAFGNNNQFTEIASTRTVAYTISLGTTTQTVDAFTVAGTAGNVITVQGTAANNPATLILTSGTVTTPNYLAITGVRAYALSDTWYAGANSTNNGSLGWIFEAGVVPVLSNNNMFLMF